MDDSVKYIEQYERVKRWYHRFEEINTGKIHDRSLDYSYDDILAFFQNCYHLRDWIKNDKLAPKNIKDGLKSFIDSNDCFRYCADITNASKHLELNPSRKIQQDIDKGPRKLFIDIRRNDEIIKEEYFFLVGDCKISAFELATNCLQKWEEYLSDI